MHQLGPARASCFSRLEGSGPRGLTLCPQRLKALVSAQEELIFSVSGSFLPRDKAGPWEPKGFYQGGGLGSEACRFGPPLTLLFSLAPMDQALPSGSFHASTRPHLQELRRETSGKNW